MKIIQGNKIDFIPASHEDPKNPGVLKKVLAKRDDLIDGRIQMINWAHLPVGKAFEPHYHEDMEEVFVILAGQVEITINHESETLTKGDAVIIPIKAVHTMKNTGDQPAEYLALGIALEQGGKTINV